MKKLVLLLALMFAAAPALAQVIVSCPAGFPGVTPTDCVASWETPSADAPTIALFQMRADGAGTPVSIGLPPKTTTSGVDKWSLPLPAAFRALPAGTHTVQVESCPAGTATCSAFSAASNAFLSGVLTSPRNLTVSP